MVGNGVTNWKYDTTPAFVEMAYWHGLYDDDLYATLKNCDLSFYQWNADKLNAECKAAMDRFDTLTAQINGYDVFGKCWKSTAAMKMYDTNTEFGLTKVGGEVQAYNKFFTMADYTPFLYKHKETGRKLREIPPCVFAAPILTYLNDAKVKQQLHVSADAPKWDLCNPVDYTESQSGSVDAYVTLKGKYRMLKYSGDTDGSVPTKGTLDWINDLNWTVTAAWRPYYIIDDNGQQQVAGYVEQREGGFTFASVHGAGHMAPQWKRQQTYHAIFQFVKNQAL